MEYSFRCGYDRILKVARTIADLEGDEDLEPKHLSDFLLSVCSLLM